MTMRATLWTIGLAGLSACSGAPSAENRVENMAAANRVATSGKTEVAIADVPAPVLAAARAARPGFAPLAAETETREGRRYFDIEGGLPDGSEIEFDIMEENGTWRVVETQRDIAFGAAPAPVQAAARARDPALAPTRVIESVQADRLVIYEIYRGERKLEVKWDGRTAEVLAREWAH
jgi:hypothetical protein